MSTTGPLEGLVVADFSRVLAGPYATMLLGDLGASVVKVESSRGDETRRWGPPWAGDGASTYYLSVNRNKRSITLDLADESDLADARAIAARADVLIENFRSGSLERLGLGYEMVREHNPGIVYCSISGFGSASRLPGYDVAIQAASGLMSMTGPDAEHPSKVGVAVADVVTGLHAGMGILAALRHRDRTGEGQRLEVNLLSSMLSGLVNAGGAYAEAGFVSGPMGTRHPSLCPYEALPTADRPLVVAVGNDAQFAALCAELGLGELPEDPRYATNASRVAHRDELTELLSGRLRERGVEEWVAALGEAGVPCAPVNDVGEGIALAESLGLDPVPKIAGRRTVSSPFRLSGTPVSYRQPPPELDEGADAVRAWLKGERLP